MARPGRSASPQPPAVLWLPPPRTLFPTGLAVVSQAGPRPTESPGPLEERGGRGGAPSARSQHDARAAQARVLGEAPRPLCLLRTFQEGAGLLGPSVPSKRRARRLEMQEAHREVL